MKQAILILGAITMLPVHAQVYKCVEGGKTVFSDRPCHLDAQPEVVRPAAGGYDQNLALEAEARTARQRAAQAEASAERARVAAEHARRRASTPKKLNRCEQLHKDYNDAMELAREYRHPDNISREMTKARHAQDRSFWECSPDNRISILR